MRVRVLGGGFYGCHITSMLLRDGYDVELHEIASTLFPALAVIFLLDFIVVLIIQGQKLTRVFVRATIENSWITTDISPRHVPVNLYCVAAYDSLLDFGTYCDILRGI
jgi:hypothetical protein